MLLPQSSAFAALKNRLNSVSAIGYLHIAPRRYVTYKHLKPFVGKTLRVSNLISSISEDSLDSPETHISNSTSVSASSSGSSNYDRPNRLKGRDEAGIRWVELLDKFKSVQEKARRSLRPGGEHADDGGAGTAFGHIELRGDLDPKALADLARLQTPTPPLVPPKGGVGAGVGQVPGHKPRTSLSNKFGLGRSSGGISGSRAKK